MNGRFNLDIAVPYIRKMGFAMLLVAFPYTLVSQTAPSFPGYDFESRFVDIDGTRMHYITHGTGDPILLLHGAPSWSYLWRGVVPGLSNSGRVIALDLAGYGLSDKPAEPVSFERHGELIGQFIERLELDRVTLVAHDWGTYFAWQYAMDHEPRVAAIAVMEAILPSKPGFPVLPEELEEKFRQMLAAFSEAGGDTGCARIVSENLWVERFLPAGIIRDLSSEEMAAYRYPFEEEVARRHICVLREGFNSARRDSVISEYVTWMQTTTVPILLLTFEPGGLGNERQVAWVRENAPRVEIKQVGYGLHFVQEDQPERIATAVSQWLRSIAHEAVGTTLDDPAP